MTGSPLFELPLHALRGSLAEHIQPPQPTGGRLPDQAGELGDPHHGGILEGQDHISFFQAGLLGRALRKNRLDLGARDFVQSQLGCPLVVDVGAGHAEP